MAETYTLAIRVQKMVTVSENASGISRYDLQQKIEAATKEEQDRLKEAIEAVAYSLLAYGEDRTKEV